MSSPCVIIIGGPESQCELQAADVARVTKVLTHCKYANNQVALAVKIMKTQRATLPENCREYVEDIAQSLFRDWREVIKMQKRMVLQHSLLARDLVQYRGHTRQKVLFHEELLQSEAAVNPKRLALTLKERTLTLQVPHTSTKTDINEVAYKSFQRFEKVVALIDWGVMYLKAILRFCSLNKDDSMKARMIRIAVKDLNVALDKRMFFDEVFNKKKLKDAMTRRGAMKKSSNPFNRRYDSQVVRMQDQIDFLKNTLDRACLVHETEAARIEVKRLQDVRLDWVDTLNSQRIKKSFRSIVQLLGKQYLCDPRLKYRAYVIDDEVFEGSSVATKPLNEQSIEYLDDPE